MYNLYYSPVKCVECNGHTVRKFFPSSVNFSQQHTQLLRYSDSSPPPPATVKQTIVYKFMWVQNAVWVVGIVSVSWNHSWRWQLQLRHIYFQQIPNHNGELHPTLYFRSHSCAISWAPLRVIPNVKYPRFVATSGPPKYLRLSTQWISISSSPTPSWSP